MSPEDRAAAERHRADRAPGDPAKRAAARRRRQNNADARALLTERADHAQSQEAAEIAAAISALRAERDQLLAQSAATAEDHDFNNYTDGVFG